MVAAILEDIRAHVEAKNPGVFSSSHAGARQLENGRVVLVDFRSEMTSVGLSDIRGDFFYIRSEGSLDYSDADEQITACAEARVELEARAVFWVKRGSQDKMIEAFGNDILSYSGNVSGAYNIRTKPRAVIIDHEVIFKEETLSDNARKPRGVALLVIDFDISYIYRTQSSDCIDRNFCEPC